MNKYLVSTNLGNIYSIEDNKSQLILKDDSNSIYTNDKSIRFIKKYKDGYLVGKSESILIWCRNGGKLQLPGLIDIKDVVVGSNFCAILSGLRDSIYILDNNFNQIITCININQEGKIEFFKDRQVQCNEIPSNYFQIFYCPRMNNYHKLNKLELLNSDLYIISYENKYAFKLDLKNFNMQKLVAVPDNKQLLPYHDINKLLKDETITDWIEC